MEAFIAALKGSQAVAAHFGSPVGACAPFAACSGMQDQSCHPIDIVKKDNRNAVRSSHSTADKSICQHASSSYGDTVPWLQPDFLVGPNDQASLNSQRLLY